MYGEADLIAVTITSDEIGNQIETETKNHILTFERSITRAEWRDAGRRELNPSLCLVTQSCNYNGENVIEYCGKRYGIYRTYPIDEEIELYLEYKDGVQETEVDPPAGGNAEDETDTGTADGQDNG